MYSFRQLLETFGVKILDPEIFKKRKYYKNLGNHRAVYTHLLTRAGSIESVLGHSDVINSLDSAKSKILDKEIISNCIQDNSLINYDIPFPQKKEYEFTFADIFCNIGGATLGLMNEGGRCIFSLESEKTKWAYAYMMNFGIIPYIYPELLKGDYPNPDVVISSVDIQEIPLIERGKIDLDNLRETSFYRLLEIINKMQPKAIIIESRKTQLDETLEKSISVVIRAIKELTGYYVVQPAILDAKNYGVPQIRRRLWFAAFSNPISAMEFQWPKPQKRTWKLRDIIEENPDPKYYISKLHDKYIEENNIKNIQKNNKFLSRILDLEKDSYPILYGGQGWDRNIVHQPEKAPKILPNGCECNEKGLRRLTSKELYRLQGFPDDFLFLDGWRLGWGLMSRATNVKVASAVVKSVKRAIDDNIIIEHAKGLIKSGLNFNKK